MSLFSYMWRKHVEKKKTNSNSFYPHNSATHLFLFHNKSTFILRTMGKKGDKNKGYTHKKTYNKEARESDDRRANRMTHMTVTRLKKLVDKQTELMRYYIPVESKKKVRLGIVTPPNLHHNANVTRMWHFCRS